MKKFKLVALVVMLAFLVTVPGFVNTVDAAPEVKVTIDGKYVSFPDQKPYIDKNNRTLVPVRAPMEHMGCTVDWNADKRQAVITKDNVTAIFTIGSRNYTVNGQNQTMDTQAVITGDRTAFPIRFAAEAMGAKVYWGQNERTVYIVTEESSVKTTLTDADIKKLQEYDYTWDAHNPNPGDEMGALPYVDLISANFVDNKLLKDGLNHIMNRCFKPNQEFLTHRDLTWFARNGDFGIRGILITPNPDGSYTEQDYECFVGWTGVKFVNPYTEKLGSPRIK